jgi:hypothetical protein
LNPAVDFTSLGTSCTVQNIDLIQRTEQDGRVFKCYHDYTYLFTYKGNDITVPRGTILKSRKETILLFNGPCPSYPLDPKGTFRKGTTRECWKPTGTPNSDYRCGNSACIKVRRGLPVINCFLSQEIFSIVEATAQLRYSGSSCMHRLDAPASVITHCNPI